ncbi:MAG: glycoside hydrolase family 5 protein [candidate division WOR-3 bacterium]
MDMLKVEGTSIVDAKGRKVRLRGFGVGGWMNSENFINGYPGFESGLRAALAEELGPAKAEFFWDRMLDCFLAEDDIKLMKELGCTVVRLPLNYRHFEADEAPGVWLEKGYNRLNQVLAWCRKHELYAILDMHAVPGWQDPDWHSDHYGRLTLIWSHKQFQDRFVALWEEFARRYKDEAVIAGYNIMNEPVTGVPWGFFGFLYKSNWDALNRLNRRTIEAIRRIDPNHIIFLEGDKFSVLFTGMDAPFADNLVYSSHNYIRPCLGIGPYPGEFQGARWDKTAIASNFAEQEGTQFCRRHGVPLWVGEFGAALDGKAEEVPDRLRALDDQIDVFEQAQVDWTIWTWKDMGMMGLATVDPESDYARTIAPVLKAKRELGTDCWVSNQPQTQVQKQAARLADAILARLPETGVDPAQFRFYVQQSLLSNFTGAFLQPLYARCFKGMTEAQLDRTMQSFALPNCRINQGLKKVLSKHLSLP